MNALLPVDSGSGAPPQSRLPEAPTAPAASIPAEIAALFRRSLSQGRVHPLMPLLLRYRQSPGDRGPQ
jgi:hypothetical protein